MYSKRTAGSDDFQNINQLFSGITPKNTTIFTDMTGTLIEQTDNGFPETHRENLRRFLDQDGQLVIITGDSLFSLETHFIPKLNYQGTSPIYFAILGGQEVYRYQHGRFSSIAVQKNEPYPPKFQQQITDVFAEKLSEAFGVQASVIQKNLQPCGNKTIIQDILGTDDKCFIEIFPTKITIAFPGGQDIAANEQAKKVKTLDLIESALRDDLSVKAQGAKIMRGDKYVDVILSTKDDGIKLLYASLPELAPRKNLILMGDSENDLGIFTYPYPGKPNVKGFFFGRAEAVFEKIQQASSAAVELHFWQGLYTKGSQLVLESICRRE
jgi:hydroxymethylpyrimidine pyrophosphatase-like HAD family hydrolase